MRKLPRLIGLLAVAGLVFGLGLLRAQDASKAAPGQVDPAAKTKDPGGAGGAGAAGGGAAQPGGAAPAAALKGPDPAPDPPLGPVLPTKPDRRGALRYNWIVADASPLPKDRAGIWVLEFAFKPIRMIDVELPGKGRRRIHYLYYRVVNRTGKPRMFVPQFTLVTDEGRRYEDTVLPQAVKLIQAREDPATNLLGAVTVTGMIPPSTREGIDDAVYGVAVWDDIPFRADAFKVFVRGLSDGYQEVRPPGNARPFTRYKALRIDFTRPGDERNPHEREIRLLDPPYEWVYYP